ncbi:MAG TPA: hypothetical protein VI818_07660 [Candidatus Thermoplasmatota archaeon]|nr:hypothetical protein [Candidatus Thermoplasmatota archaeon]
MVDEQQVELYLVLLKFVTVLLGFYIVYLGYKAYRKQPHGNLLWMTVGMGVLTLGAISEGIAYQGLGWTLGASHIFEAVVTLLGFGILVYSLFAK